MHENKPTRISQSVLENTNRVEMDNMTTGVPPAVRPIALGVIKSNTAIDVHNPTGHSNGAVKTGSDDKEFDVTKDGVLNKNSVKIDNMNVVPPAVTPMTLGNIINNETIDVNILTGHNEDTVKNNSDDKHVDVTEDGAKNITGVEIGNMTTVIAPNVTIVTVG